MEVWTYVHLMLIAHPSSMGKFIIWLQRSGTRTVLSSGNVRQYRLTLLLRTDQRQQRDKSVIPAS